jgi:hypothetical protein
MLTNDPVFVGPTEEITKVIQVFRASVRAVPGSRIGEIKTEDASDPTELVLLRFLHGYHHQNNT